MRRTILTSKHREETQQGAFFTEELGRKHPGGLYNHHQDWVEHLARAAEMG
jgi:hypothetical protein